MHKALTSSVPHSVAISSSIQYLDRIEAKDFLLEVEIFKVSRDHHQVLLSLYKMARYVLCFNAICSDFEHMKGYDGLETCPPKKMKEISREKYKDLNYDKISPGITPSFIHQLSCTVHRVMLGGIEILILMMQKLDVLPICKWMEGSQINMFYHFM